MNVSTGTPHSAKDNENNALGKVGHRCPHNHVVFSICVVIADFADGVTQVAVRKPTGYLEAIEWTGDSKVNCSKSGICFTK